MRLFIRNVVFFVLLFFGAISVPLPKVNPDLWHLYEFALLDFRSISENQIGGVVSLGASQLAFGIDGDKLNEQFHPFVNTGIHAGFGGKFVLNQISSIDSSNLLIFSPVYEWLSDPNFSESILSRLAIVHGPAKKALLETKGLSGYIMFRVQIFKWWTQPPSREIKLRGWWDRRAFGKYGTLDQQWIKPSDYLPTASAPWSTLDCECAWMKTFFKGRKAVLLPPPIRMSQYSPNLDDFWRICADEMGIPLLLKQSQAAFADTVFLDDRYHLDMIGRKNYTEEIMKALSQSVDFPDLGQFEIRRGN